MDAVDQVDINSADAPHPKKAKGDRVMEAAFGTAVLLAMAGWLYALYRGVILAIGWMI